MTQHISAEYGGYVAAGSDGFGYRQGVKGMYSSRRVA